MEKREEGKEGCWEQRGSDVQGKGNCVSVLLGILSGSSSALTTAQQNAPSSAFSMQICCQIMLFVSVLPTVSPLHWVNYNQAAIAPLWMGTSLCEHTSCNFLRLWMKFKRHLINTACRKKPNKHVFRCFMMYTREFSECMRVRVCVYVRIFHLYDNMQIQSNY